MKNSIQKDVKLKRIPYLKPIYTHSTFQAIGKSSSPTVSDFPERSNSDGTLGAVKSASKNYKFTLSGHVAIRANCPRIFNYSERLLIESRRTRPSCAGVALARRIPSGAVLIKASKYPHVSSAPRNTKNNCNFLPRAKLS